MAGLNSITQSKILITGGGGFVGSSIIRRLLAENCREIILFDNRADLPESLKSFQADSRLKVVAGDIRNPGQVKEAMAGCDYVYHQAAIRVTKCAKEPRLAHEIMADGSFNVFSACAEQKIKKVIFASSAIVYGEPVKLPLDENHPAHDLTTYGIIKIFNENLLQSFHKQYGLNFVALRYFNIYGEGMNLFGDEVEVLVRWLDRIDQGLAPLVFGDGKQTLDYIHIDDIVEANWKALTSDASGEIFNVCTGRETSVNELLQLMLKIRRSKLQPEYQPGRTVNQVARRFGSPDKAEKDMGFKARISLEEGLERFVTWRDSMINREKEKTAEVQLQ